MGKEEAEELAQFIENDYGLYRSQYVPIVNNLARKRVKGVFQKDLALKLIVYLVENGRKEYKRQVGSDVWGGRRVSYEEKLAVARELYGLMMEAVRDTAAEIRKARAKKKKPARRK
jgi:hypothetical protein